MLKELKKNNRGIVFVTVLIVVIVAITLTISLLSLNISQVRNAEDEVKYIQARILSEGGLAQMLINQLSDSSANFITDTVTLEGTTFTIVTNIDSSGAGPTYPLNINVIF